MQGVAHLALRHVLRAALQPALGYRVSTGSLLNIISWTNLQLVRQDGGEQHEQGGEGQCGMHGHHWALFSTIYSTFYSTFYSTIYHHPPLFSTRHGPRPLCQSAACVGVGGDSIHNADKWADKLCSAGCISQISPYITLYTVRALQPPPPDCARPGGCARRAVRGAWRKQTVS